MDEVGAYTLITSYCASLLTLNQPEGANEHSQEPSMPLVRRRSKRKSIRSEAAEEAIRVSGKGRYMRK
jgi:hypothetical protein